MMQSGNREFKISEGASYVFKSGGDDSKSILDLVQKAATDFEVSGALTPTLAYQFLGDLQANSNILAKFNKITLPKLTADLSDYIVSGLLTDRAGAEAATGDAIGTNGNVGNEVTLLELYYLYNILSGEIANMQLVGNHTSVVEQKLLWSWVERLDQIALTGTVATDKVNGLITDAKLNLADKDGTEDAIETLVRVSNTNTVTDIEDRLDNLILKIRSKYKRNKKAGAIYTSSDEYQAIKKEARSKPTTFGDRVWIDGEVMRFDGYDIIEAIYMESGSMMHNLYENMGFCVSASQPVNREVEEIKRPKRIEITYQYWLAFKNVTHGAMVYSYDAGA